MDDTVERVTFALCDASSTPNSKIGAAFRKQAPVLVANLLAAMKGEALSASYNGYASCPLTTARNRMLLAEFDSAQALRPAGHVLAPHVPRARLGSAPPDSRKGLGRRLR
jgi:hypothetical protein